MPTIGNKKTSQLVEITAAEIATNDLFYVVDTSARESKKMQAYQLATWLNASGSLYAFFATFADTASYILGSNVNGTVTSASWSGFAGSTISSSWASSSNSSISSSHALTASYASNAGTGTASSASYLIYAGFVNGTASYALAAATALIVNTASFLLYTPGAFNGTASFALTAGNANSAITANTASYVDLTGKVSSASWSDNSNLSISSSFSTYANNANHSLTSTTASYAISSKNVGNVIVDYGIFDAITQSISSSQLDKVDVYSVRGYPTSTNIEAIGTVIVFFTSSVLISEVLYLRIKDRNVGTETTIDSTPILININPTIGTWDSHNSGSIKIPYTLMGKESLYGSYMVYVTSSGVGKYVQLDSNRTNKYCISSLSENLSVSSDVPLLFSVTPDDYLIAFSSSAGGPFSDYVPGILITGSNEILTLDFLSIPIITSVKNIWTLTNLTTFKCANSSLSYVSGFPDSLTYLDVHSNALTSLFDLDNTSMTYFDCSNNQIISMSKLPATLQYIDISGNPITSFPQEISSSSGLTTLYFNNTNLPLLFTSFPNSVVSMSFSDNLSMTAFASNLPSNLVSLCCSGSPIGSLTTLPSASKHINVSNCDLSLTAMDTICSDLVTSGLLTGSLDIRYNGMPQASTVGSIVTLTSRNWSVLYDLV